MVHWMNEGLLNMDLPAEGDNMPFLGVWSISSMSSDHLDLVATESATNSIFADFSPSRLWIPS